MVEELVVEWQETTGAGMPYLFMFAAFLVIGTLATCAML